MRLETDTTKGVFLSYRRRVGWQSARLVYYYLTAHGFDVFMDIESLGSGAIQSVIEHQIGARPHFVIVLNPDSLRGVRDEHDWLRRELTLSLATGRNIVPVLFDGFSFGTAENTRLAADIEAVDKLSQRNGINVPADYFNEAMARLSQQFLVLPGGAITPTPSGERAAVEEMVAKAKRADEAMGALPDAISPASSDIDKAFTRIDSGRGAWIEVPVFFAIRPGLWATCPARTMSARAPLECTGRATRAVEAHRCAIVLCNNFGAPVGQSQQLVHDPGRRRGAGNDKSLAALARQSN